MCINVNFSKRVDVKPQMDKGQSNSQQKRVESLTLGAYVVGMVQS